MSFGFSPGDFITVLQLAKEIRRRFVDAPEQFKAITADLKILVNVFEDINDIQSERDLTSEQRKRVDDEAQSCHIVLQELNDALDKYQELDFSIKGVGGGYRRVWKRLKWDQKNIDQFRDRLNIIITAFNTLLGLISLKVSLASKAEVERLHELSENRERYEEHQTILDWLTPIDYTSQQNDYFSRHEEGTGEWFLTSTEFQDWLHQTNQTLFCPGIPGAGKTILAAIVVDHLFTKFQNITNVGIVYLYCNFRRKDEQKPADMLINLLKQLLYRSPLLPESVKRLYKFHRNKRSRPSFDEISQELQSVIITLSNTFIIIDALDECQTSDGGCKRVLSELFKIQTTNEVSLLATSRFIPEIGKDFEGSTLLEIRASDKDVRRYLEGYNRQLPSFVSHNSGLQEEITTKIIKAVDGMFLLANLHLSSLERKKSPKAIRNALAKLAIGSEAYDCAYKEAMDRIQCQVSDARELAQQVLSWIICAKRPLTTLELRHALAVELGESELDEQNLPEIEDIVSVCAGLVTVDEESDIVRLVHHTTQEYFERNQSSCFPNAERDITRTCITYLSLKYFEAGFCLTDTEFETRLQLNPLYDYAARHWGEHAKECSVEKNVVLSFLKSEARVSSAFQAMTARKWYSSKTGYSQRVPRKRTGPHLAAYIGLREALVGLIESMIGLDSKDEAGRTPLSLAAECGREAVIALLLGTKKVDLNSIDNGGKTPLSYAASNGCETVVKLLLATEGIDPDTKDNSGRTPLSLGACSGNEAIVKLLLAAESNVNPDSKDKNNRSPLFWAAHLGQEAVVKLLLAVECNVDPNSKDIFGRTPLASAACYGYEAVVKLLLAIECNVDPDLKDSIDRTPLSYAAERGHNTVVELLLATKGADSNSKDSKGRTPVSYAAGHGREAIIKLLLAAEGVDPDSKDTEGRSPLSWGARYGHEAIVKLILAVGDIDLNSKDNNGWTPLLWAASGGHEAVVRFLMEQGSNVNTLSEDGKSVIALASAKWLTRLQEEGAEAHDGVKEDQIRGCLIALLEHTSSASNKNLHLELLNIATVKGSVHVLKKVAAHVAAPNIVDEHGWTAAHFARVYESERILQSVYSNFDIVLLGAMRTMAPSRFSTTKQNKSLNLSRDGLQCFLDETNNGKAASAIANHPIPAEVTHYYYEMTIISGENEYPMVGLGFLSEEASLVGMPGWKRYPKCTSFGFHGDNGKVYGKAFDGTRCGRQYNIEKPAMDYRCKIGDTIGCGFDVKLQEIYYTCNVEYLGPAFTEVRNRHMFPAVGIRGIARVALNFGQEPFKYNGERK